MVRNWEGDVILEKRVAEVDDVMPQDRISHVGQAFIMEGEGEENKSYVLSGPSGCKGDKKRTSWMSGHYVLKKSFLENHPQKSGKIRWVEMYRCIKCSKVIKNTEGLGNSDLLRHLKNQHELNKDGSASSGIRTLDAYVQKWHQLSGVV